MDLEIAVICHSVANILINTQQQSVSLKVLIVISFVGCMLQKLGVDFGRLTLAG